VFLSVEFEAKVFMKAFFQNFFKEAGKDDFVPFFLILKIRASWTFKLSCYTTTPQSKEF
jgi:hypothetical protein